MLVDMQQKGTNQMVTLHPHHRTSNTVPPTSHRPRISTATEMFRRKYKVQWVMLRVYITASVKSVHHTHRYDHKILVEPERF